MTVDRLEYHVQEGGYGARRATEQLAWVRGEQERPSWEQDPVEVTRAELESRRRLNASWLATLEDVEAKRQEAQA